MTEITQILRRIEGGDSVAGSELLPLVYAKRAVLAENEVRNWMYAKWRFGIAANLKIDARTTTIALPWRDFGLIELRQKSRAIGMAVFEHPSHETPLMVREVTI